LTPEAALYKDAADDGAEQSLKMQVIDFIQKESNGTVDLNTLKQAMHDRNDWDLKEDRLAEVAKLDKRLLTTINRSQTIFIK
jgi:hypothetical protein